MKSKYSLRIELIILLSVILATSLSAATIRTTPQGGNWHSTSTWLGGVVPGAEDDVIIDAKVIKDADFEAAFLDSCASLIITGNGILESHPSEGSLLIVAGDFQNSGIVRDADNIGFVMYFNGDILNYGEIENLMINAVPTKPVCSISGTFDSNVNISPFEENPAHYHIIAGAANFKRDLWVFSPLIVDDNAEMTIVAAVHEGVLNPDNLITTKGVLKQNTGVVMDEADFDSGGYLKLSFAENHPESQRPLLETHGSRTHPNMQSSVARWWRLADAELNAQVDPYIIELNYEDELLNGLEATTLHAYISKDEGLTWTKISTATNIIRNTADKIITVGTKSEPIMEGGGDIILAPGENDVVIPSALSVGIVGPDEIRVGAPNRYKVAYWNNGTEYSGNFFLKVKLSGGAEINKIITSYPDDDTPVEYTIDEINSNGDKTYGFFLINGLQGGEYSSFDMIIDCMPEGGEIEEIQAIPVVIAVAAKYIAGAIIKDYIVSLLTNSCYEIITHDNNSITDLLKNIYEGGIKKANSKFSFVTPVESLAGSLAGDIIKKTVGGAVWPAELALMIYDCFDDVADGLNEARAEKYPERIYSWDPNSKTGPTGFGNSNFMSSVSPMIYTIDFENLPEATAPAYRVVIEDFLDESVFDVSSVEMLGMSHNMGVFTQTGNMLHWEFVEIELPPNKNPPEGEGWVTFKVNLKDNLPSGTEIKNSASIIFDLNEPIITNETINILDFDEPYTLPSDLPDITETRSINLTWESNDGNGSGVDLAYVYSSVNDGPFSLAGATTFREMKIDVSPGHNYKFFVLSRDYVGNVETEPTKIVSTSTEVSVSDYEAVKSFKVYPNPANGSFNVFLNLTEIRKFDVLVFDGFGRIIYQSGVSPLTNEVYVPVDVENIAAGVYYVRINIGNISYLEKVILY